MIKKKEKGARWVLASGGAFINVRYGSGNCQKLTGGRNRNSQKGCMCTKTGMTDSCSSMTRVTALAGLDVNGNPGSSVYPRRVATFRVILGQQTGAVDGC